MSLELKVSIIIVNYNTKELLRNCLKSVYAQTKDIDFEVIVSDNGSKDGSVEMIKSEFPAVILIENDANLGFGAANNKGLDIAKGKYIFYLNSDTLLLNNAVKLFYDFWENAKNKDEIGCLGCILKDKDFSDTHSGGSFPTYKSICKWQLNKNIVHFIKSFSKLFKLQRLYLNIKTKKNSEIFSYAPGKIDYITGADLFLRNNSFARFDERFFMYYEETDLQLTMKKNGYQSFLIDSPKIIHFYKKDDKTFKISSFSDIFSQNSAIIYSKKNLSTKAYLLRFLISFDWLNPYIWKIRKNICPK